MREIQYTVGVDKIDPFTVQFAGYAGEDNVTTLKFTFDEELSTAIAGYGVVNYLLEVRDSSGRFEAYVPLSDTSGTNILLTFLVPADITTLSGRVTMQLSIVKLDADNNQERKLFTYPIKLRFDPSTSSGVGGSENVDRYTHNLVGAMKTAVDAADRADTAVASYVTQDTESIWVDGSYVNQYGAFSTNSDFKRTLLLKTSLYTVEEICLAGRANGSVSSVAYYNENGTFIIAQTGASITGVTIPDNAYYMAFSIEKSVDGNRLCLKRKQPLIAQRLDAVEEDVYITQDTKSLWIDDSYINGLGDIVTHADFKRTQLLKTSLYTVEAIDLIGRANGVVSSVAYYKEDGTFISAQTGASITDVEVPTNAYYMAFSIEKKYENRLYLKQNQLEIARQINAVKKSVYTGGLIKMFRTIGVVGDSLSSGAMTYRIDDTTTANATMYEYSWLQYMARTYCLTGYNFSMGGLSTRTFLEDVGGYLTMLENDEYKCQAYFIALGHNDYNQGVALGTEDDIDLNNYENNADTYYGNYAEIIQRIKAKCPYAKIFVITLKNNYSMPEYDEYNTAIRYMATVFNDVYVLDMNIKFPTVPEEHFTEGHGNAMGYYQYSLEIQNLVDETIRNNPEDFMYVQFINTEYEVYIPTAEIKETEVT